jgi:ABC-type antimicrobial peptide transport system permease subunit
LNVRWRYRWHAFRRVHGQARSLLAVACLAIGIVTLTQVLALGAGTRAQMAAILADAGTRTLTINAGTVRGLPNRGSLETTAETLTLDDYRLLAAAPLPVTALAAISANARRVEYRELAIGATITGTQPAWFAIQHYRAEHGRLLEDADDATFARVAVLGARSAEQLFGANQESVLAPEAALGNTILIGSMPFTVVGILAARGSNQAGLSQDEGVYVPLSTALRRVFNVDYLNNIVVEVAEVALLPTVRQQAEVLLRANHGLAPDAVADFTLLDATRAVAAAARSQQFANVFFRGLALLMLGMAGAGIFAVNHLNVKERAGEFGLRRAVGARQGDIARLVLGETLLLGLAGGLAGSVVGLGLLYALRALTAWNLVPDAIIPAQALGAALILSMLAALVPAWNAAARPPVLALKSWH